MATSKYFTVTVKPTIAASKQALGAFTANDVLFNWTEFDIPKGAARLIGVTTLVRGTDGARQEKALDLSFAKTISGTAPSDIGTVHATANGSGYQNHLIGGIRIDANDYKDGLDIMALASSGYGASTTQIPSHVLQGEPETGTNVGFDKLYIAATGAAFNFASTVQVATETATSTSAVVVKTTSALTNFDKGDVLHDEDDQLIGTIKSVTDATNIVLEANAANVSAVNKDLYNINPLTFILSFER